MANKHNSAKKQNKTASLTFFWILFKGISVKGNMRNMSFFYLNHCIKKKKNLIIPVHCEKGPLHNKVELY